jgi:hypothetical protein
MVFDQRLAADFKQRFGYGVGERTQALSAPRRQNEGFHAIISRFNVPAGPHPRQRPFRQRRFGVVLAAMVMQADARCSCASYGISSTDNSLYNANKISARAVAAKR